MPRRYSMATASVLQPRACVNSVVSWAGILLWTSQRRKPSAEIVFIQAPRPRSKQTARLAPSDASHARRPTEHPHLIVGRARLERLRPAEAMVSDAALVLERVGRVLRVRVLVLLRMRIVKRPLGARDPACTLAIEREVGRPACAGLVVAPAAGWG